MNGNFEEIKELFFAEVDKLNYNNVNQEADILINYLTLLKSLAVREIQQSQGDFQQDSDLAKKEKGHPWVEGHLHRQLKGGILEGTDIYVPERSIREFGFEDGDLIRARSQGVKHTGSRSKEFYYFDIIAKGNPSHSMRREVFFCQVLWDRDVDQYYIQAKIDDHEEKLYLKTEDVYSLAIQEDDRIDYAFWSGQERDGSVAWKYTLNGPVVGQVKNGAPGERNALMGKKFVVAVEEGQARPYWDELDRLGASFLSLEEVNQAYKEDLPLYADGALVVYNKVPLTAFETLRKKLQYDNIPTIYMYDLDVENLYQVVQNHF